MDRLLTLARRIFRTAFEHNAIKWQLIIMVMLLTLQDCDFIEEKWGIIFMSGMLPLKLLAWPTKLTLHLLPYICLLPPVPDMNVMNIMIITNLQIISGITLGASIDVNCQIHPSYCYEGVPEDKDDWQAETEMIFYMIQAVIVLNMAFFTWFLLTVLRFFMSQLRGLVNISTLDIVLAVMITNLLYLLTSLSLNTGIYLMAAMIILWNINGLLTYRITGIAITLVITIESTEMDQEDDEEEDAPEDNPYINRFHFMESDDEDLSDE